MKLRLLGYRSTLPTLGLLSVLLFMNAVVFHGCGRVSDEQLARAVETAMNQVIYRREAEAVDNLTRITNRLAVEQLERFNNAEKVYDNAVRFEPIPRNPYEYGYMYKVKRDFSNHTIADMRESDSLLHEYEVLVSYNYEILQTEKQSTVPKGAEQMAKEDFDFERTGKKGAIEYVYRFNEDFECLNRGGELVRTSGEQIDIYYTCVTPAVGGTTPPVRITTKVIQAVRKGATQTQTRSP